jgi:hypothetical protein
MKKLLIYISVFLSGVLFTQIPDLISLYQDHVISTYREKDCHSKGIDDDKCKFDMFFYDYKSHHEGLNRVSNYFQLSEGTLYYVLSGRCSNRLAHGPSALGNESGKITMREYFNTQCGYFRNDLSNLIYGN